MGCQAGDSPGVSIRASRRHRGRARKNGDGTARHRRPWTHPRQAVTMRPGMGPRHFRTPPLEWATLSSDAAAQAALEVLVVEVGTAQRARAGVGLAAVQHPPVVEEHGLAGCEDVLPLQALVIGELLEGA